MTYFEGEDVGGVGEFEEQAEVSEEQELLACFAEEEVCGEGHASELFAALQVHGAGERGLQAFGLLGASARLRGCTGLREQTVEQRACVAEEQRVEGVEQREEVVVAA